MPPSIPLPSSFSKFIIHVYHMDTKSLKSLKLTLNNCFQCLKPRHDVFIYRNFHLCSAPSFGTQPQVSFCGGFSFFSLRVKCSMSLSCCLSYASPLINHLQCSTLFSCGSIAKVKFQIFPNHLTSAQCYALVAQLQNEHYRSYQCSMTDFGTELHHHLIL